MNLLQETIEAIELQGKSVEDVQWVGDEEGYYTTWEDFKERADFDYDDSYGAHEIPLGLKVVGSDWWLERHEYDGSEWWEFKSLPVKPVHSHKIQLRL